MKMTLTAKGLLPFGLKCMSCNRTAKAGQWVMYHRTFNACIHRGCAVELIAEVDENEISMKDAFDGMKVYVHDDGSINLNKIWSYQ